MTKFHEGQAVILLEFDDEPEQRATVMSVPKDADFKPYMVMIDNVQDGDDDGLREVMEEHMRSAF